MGWISTKVTWTLVGVKRVRKNCAKGLAQKQSKTVEKLLLTSFGSWPFFFAISQRMQKCGNRNCSRLSLAPDAHSCSCRAIRAMMAGMSEAAAHSATVFMAGIVQQLG
jgi:hypothetical protein